MKIPRIFALYRLNNSVFLLYNGIRNAQVVGSSPTTSSMFYPLFRMKGRVFCMFLDMSVLCAHTSGRTSLALGIACTARKYKIWRKRFKSVQIHGKFSHEFANIFPTFFFTINISTLQVATKAHARLSRP